MRWPLTLMLLLPNVTLAQPMKNIQDGWEARQECWRDGTVEECRGQLVDRKAFYQAGVPVYLEFREKDTLVGLAVNLKRPHVQCDKLEKSFVCEFTALPIPVPEGLSKMPDLVFDDRESLMEAGVDALEIYRLNLPWEAVRVVVLESDGKVYLSVPQDNQPQDLKNTVLEGASKKERGTTYHFYVVPRIFGLGK